jgi:hypothetical protein
VATAGRRHNVRTCALSYRDYFCPYCDHRWRVEGNGGLVLGCWPNCPKCAAEGEFIAAEAEFVPGRF